MNQCGTLILGGGHAALGIALALGDGLICEESEFVDPGFSLTLKGFARQEYCPRYALGKQLLACYEELGLFSEARQNCGGFEIGLSRFAREQGAAVLLKSRVVNLEQGADGVVATVLTNAGLETMKAKRVVDTRCREGEKRFSLLFEMCGPESLVRVGTIFPEGESEPSFYPQWGALHLPVEWNAAYNQVLQQVHSRWTAKEKIVLLAPRFEVRPAAQAVPTDGGFAHPVAAFEAGYKWGRGAL